MTEPSSFFLSIARSSFDKKIDMISDRKNRRIDRIKEINIQFTMRVFLNKGGHATVYLYDENGSTVLKVADSTDHESKQQMSDEIRVFDLLLNSDYISENNSGAICIARVLEVDRVHRCWIRMERYECSLFDALKTDRLKELSARMRIMTMLPGLVRALYYVHERGVAHGDIHCGNIMLASPRSMPRLFLCDFGMCIFLDTLTCAHVNGKFNAVCRDIKCIARTLLELVFDAPIMDDRSEKLVIDLCHRDHLFPDEIDLYTRINRLCETYVSTDRYLQSNKDDDNHTVITEKVLHLIVQYSDV